MSAAWPASLVSALAIFSIEPAPAPTGCCRGRGITPQTLLRRGRVLLQLSVAGAWVAAWRDRTCCGVSWEQRCADVWHRVLAWGSCALITVSVVDTAIRHPCAVVRGAHSGLNLPTLRLSPCSPTTGSHATDSSSRLLKPWLELRSSCIRALMLGSAMPNATAASLPSSLPNHPHGCL